MRRSLLLVLFVAATGVLGACTSTPEVVKPAPNAAPSPAAPGASPAVSPVANPSFDPKAPGAAPSAKAVTLEGKWPGAGDTYLKVTRNGNKYSIEIKGADKAETFDGFAKDDTIQFKRKGNLDTIKSATPEETGLKWSGGEKNCVVITKGSEAYCRK